MRRFYVECEIIYVVLLVDREEGVFCLCFNRIGNSSRPVII